MYKLACMVLCLVLLPMGSAWAGLLDNCRTSQLPWSANLDAQATSDLAVGASVPGSDAYNLAIIDCTAGWDDYGTTCTGGVGWAINAVGGTIQPSSVPGVYTFPGMPPGVGYQFLDTAGQSIALDAVSRHDTKVVPRTGTQNVPLHFRLVKISDALATGSFTFTMQLGCNGNEWANYDGPGSSMYMTVNTTLITQTCLPVTADTLVQLPQVARTAFQGAGSTAGTTSFSVDFQCDPSANARVNITDASTPSNASDTLTLVAGSSAGGIGVRLNHQGSPVLLAPGQLFDQGGSEFPLQNPEVSPSVISLPLSAEYVQTGASITPGSAQAQAWVTIDYQ